MKPKLNLNTKNQPALGALAPATTLHTRFSILNWKWPLLLLALAAGFAQAAPLGTAFTYQGRLAADGNAAGGIYDLRFTIYDALADGSIVAGPVTNAATPVTNGLFTATLDFGGGVFDGDARWLDIAVRTNGATSFTALTPRQPLSPATYALAAGTVTGPINGGQIIAGTVTGAQLAAGAVTAANIASNSITASQLAAGAAAANLNASGQSAVAGGGMILSSNAIDSNLINDGYVKLGKVDLGDVWEESAGTNNAPAERANHKAVWTGSEMIVWGGDNGSWLSSVSGGGRYNPTANSWTAVSTNGAPVERAYHTAVWTGGEMIVWGGINIISQLNTGGRYNPTTDSWTVVSTNGAPAGRNSHTAVWTGSEMIIWGGYGSTFLNSGGRYNPANDSWTAVSTNGAPEKRSDHTAVWTGNEMIVWGGYSGSYLNSGGRYNPTTNSWTVVSTNGAPERRSDHTAVWTGNEMIVWGGYYYYGGHHYLNDGGRYNPAGNSWTAVSTNGAPAGRYHAAVWTGSEMIVWGGYNGSYLNSGGRYNLAGNSWTELSAVGAPAARLNHTTVWTGSDMIIWGGAGADSALFDDTFSYNPSRALYLYQRQ